jgi:hypothetical protein
MAVALALLAAPVGAAPIPFSVEKVSYDLQGETLKGFLQRFFDDLGIAVTLSPAVQEEAGTLNGPRSGMAASVFKGIADSNGLVGYYDGSVAFIYKTRELSSRYFEIDPARVDAFREATIGFGLPDANNTLQIKAATGVINAKGTPRFLDQLNQLSSALARKARAAAAAATSTPHMTLRFGCCYHSQSAVRGGVHCEHDRGFSGCNGFARQRTGLSGKPVECRRGLWGYVGFHRSAAPACISCRVGRGRYPADRGRSVPERPHHSRHPRAPRDV